jgi:hypothetical protein
MAHRPLTHIGLHSDLNSLAIDLVMGDIIQTPLSAKERIT